MKRDILYVDDEPDNIIVFEAAFEDEFNIHTASSGRETLQLLERIPIPLVVADQRMPEMSGIELFQIMRDRYPHTKRVILTGYTDQDAMLDAINKGQVFYFVKKPWERPFLLSVLIRALEAHDMAVMNTALTERLLMAERCSQLGQATARVAHEMGNQLCMLPLLELIEERYSDQEELVKVAQFARGTYERLVGLIQEVKTFTRFEDESFALQPLDLAEIVHELVAFLRFDQTVPHSRMKLEVLARPLVQANKVKLQQVLVNLIKNAAHAIQDRPGARIVIRVETEDESALLRVIDNGCGMTEAVQARLWEPFFTTKGKQGTGLGLDICRRLVETHGGTISCASRPGEGTTFSIRLPRLTLGGGQRLSRPA